MARSKSKLDMGHELGSPVAILQWLRESYIALQDYVDGSSSSSLMLAGEFVNSSGQVFFGFTNGQMLTDLQSNIVKSGSARCPLISLDTRYSQIKSHLGITIGSVL